MSVLYRSVTACRRAILVTEHASRSRDSTAPIGAISIRQASLAAAAGLLFAGVCGGAILITYDDDASPAVHDEIQEAGGRARCSVYSLDASLAIIASAANVVVYHSSSLRPSERSTVKATTFLTRVMLCLAFLSRHPVYSVRFPGIIFNV